jgi:hypothetical protein
MSDPEWILNRASLNKSPEEYVTYRRGHVLGLIRQAQNGEIGLLLAVREAQIIRRELAELQKRPESADLLFLTGVSSESDELPLGSERQYWAPDSLREKDAKAHAYEERIREKVLSSFARIADDLKRVL